VSNPYPPIADYGLIGDCHSAASARSYLDGTSVLETAFRTPAGEAKLIDFFAMREGGRERPRRQIVRIVEGIRGRVDFRIEIGPRFDYGEVRPWMRRIGDVERFRSPSRG
jgi:GH15 family glucan-1,4-alpha-glucosidase